MAAGTAAAGTATGAETFSMGSSSRGAFSDNTPAKLGAAASRCVRAARPHCSSIVFNTDVWSIVPLASGGTRSRGESRRNQDGRDPHAETRKIEALDSPTCLIWGHGSQGGEHMVEVTAMLIVRDDQ